jgi:hypothetical protein
MRSSPSACRDHLPKGFFARDDIRLWVAYGNLIAGERASQFGFERNWCYLSEA